jgi:hypothetical protein
MKTQKIHFELLLGKLVRDPEGARVGRIFSAHAEPEGDGWVIREFDLGAAALVARFGLTLRRLAGLPISREPRRIPWDLLDLSDPERPRLRCSLAELDGRRPSTR